MAFMGLISLIGAALALARPDLPEDVPPGGTLH